MFPKLTRDPDLRRVLLARSLRAFGDGYVAILLPFYLVRLGFEPTAVGAITTATLLGSAAATLALGRFAYSFTRRAGLVGASVAMVGTGLAFAGFDTFWALMLVAFVGTMNPSGGDVSVFLPLEHTVIAHLALDQDRTQFFAYYAFVGALWGALGALSLGALDWLDGLVGPLASGRHLFALYGLLGVATWRVYAGISVRIEGNGAGAKAPLGPSRKRVYGLAALFSVDAFAGGLIVNALLALWLSDRFGSGPTELGVIFFATSACSAISYFAAAPLAARFGLLNTMVFTHIPFERPADSRGGRTFVVDRSCAADTARAAFADGRADTFVLRDGGRYGAGASRRRQRDGRSSQPCRRCGAGAFWLAAWDVGIRVAARRGRWAEDRL
jgi:MFS family permease